MPETTQSDLVERLEAMSDTDGEYGHHARSQLLAQAATEITRLRADSERLQKIESQTDGGRFDEWSTATFAGQLRMQSRDSLDPEYSQFMAATATHLGILSGQYDAQREIAERAKEDAARLRAHCEALSTGLQLAHTMLEDYDGSQSHAGDAFKVLDITLAAYRKENPDV